MNEQNVQRGKPVTTMTARESRAEASWRKEWRKLPFLSACWISYVLLAGFGVGLYYLIAGALSYYLGTPLTGFGLVLKYIAQIGIAVFLFFPGAGLLLISLTALTGVDLLYPHGHRSITVKYLFPVAVMLAQFVGVNRNKLRASFVKVNNALTISQRKRIHNDRILVLLPHCLQIDICNRKITNDIHNCVRCGKCPVAQLLEISDRCNLPIEVVNGGTLARRRVASYRPTGIIAVACERDLTLGIQDVHPIPVYGVINDRPNGPCFNTDVDMSLVEEAVRFFKGEVSH